MLVCVYLQVEVVGEVLEMLLVVMLLLQLQDVELVAGVDLLTVHPGQL